MPIALKFPFVEFKNGEWVSDYSLISKSTVTKKVGLGLVKKYNIRGLLIIGC